MSPFTKTFMYTVTAAVVVTTSIFGGNYITTGHLIPVEKELLDIEVTDITDATEETTQKVKEVFVASADKGKKAAGKCKACHTFNKGGKNGIGPNLWGIFEQDIAHLEEFAYSSAFTDAKGQITWTEENLDAWLKKPRDFLPGNKMAFGGLKKDQDRANLIAYLKELK